MNDQREAVMKHLRMLFDTGHSHRTVSEATGVSRHVIGSLVYRDDRPVNQKAVDAIMALEVRPPWDTPGVIMADRMLIPGTGTVRRLRALARMGYPLPRIAEVVGVNEDYLQVLINSDSTARVRVGTARSVSEFYQSATRNIPGWKCSERTRRWAEDKGWAGAGAWDDIDRDEYPEAEGGLAVLVEYVKDRPGLTALDIQAKIKSELGMKGTTAGRLIREALDAGALCRIRNRRLVRVYATG